MSNINKKSNTDISSRKIKVKNKKEVSKVLTKNKGTVVTAKKSSNVRKKPTVKKTNVTNNNKPKVEEENKKVVNVEEQKNKVVNNNQAQKPNQVQKPKYKKKKPAKVVVPEAVVEQIKEDSKKVQEINEKKKEKEITPETVSTPSEEEVKSIVKPVTKIKIKKNEEEAKTEVIKKENVSNIKKRAEKTSPPVEKKKLTPTGNDKLKKVKSVYDPKLNKWVLVEEKVPVKKEKPKEKAKEKDERESYLTQTELKGLKSKFFEEINVEQYKQVKREKRKKLPKKILIFLIVILILLGGGYAFYYYNQETIKENLNLYPEYKLGQIVKLNDDKRWFVIEDSDGSNPNVSVLISLFIDVNNDGHYDNADKKQFSSGSVKYDELDDTSIAYYLENTYKAELEERIGGKIEKVSLLTSKQFVNYRNVMNYGSEWNTDNELASNWVFNYWLADSRNDKIFVVTRKGSYKMAKPTDMYYMRCVITINKNLIKELTN